MIKELRAEITSHRRPFNGSERHHGDQSPDSAEFDAKPA